MAKSLLRAKQQRQKNDGIGRHAVISQDQRYRYLLTRDWNPRDHYMLWVMLNPSTADGVTDDNTIRQCMSFARANGFGGLQVVNLFAYRATDPRSLLKAEDPVGPVNDAITMSALRTAKAVMVGWGSFKHDMAKDRAKWLWSVYGDVLWCLGVNDDGNPKHPLYISGGTQPIPWNPPDEWGL
jgi:hypothetical protein